MAGRVTRSRARVEQLELPNLSADDSPFTSPVTSDVSSDVSVTDWLG